MRQGQAKTSRMLASRTLAGTMLVIGTALMSNGCWTGGVNQVGRESLAADLTAEATPRLSRMQQPELPPPDPRFLPRDVPPPLPTPGSSIPGVPTPAPLTTTPLTTKPLTTPPLATQPLGVQPLGTQPLGTKPLTTPPLAQPSMVPPPLPGDTRQVSSIPAKNIRVSVRAWVNGKPIFDEEVMQGISSGALREVYSLSEPQRSERLAKEYNTALENIIEQEVLYQDAVRKLEKNNSKSLDKLKKYVDEEYEKQLRKIRATNRVSEAQLKDMENILRRQLERSLISMEYIRSRIHPWIQQAIGPKEIEDYYRTHLNEFQRVDTVKWQDIFIAVGPKYPTVAHAKRFAEDLIAQCRTNDDFEKLLQYNDGDSRFRNGEGLGTRKGEIKPVEVEEALFQLQEGRIGPVIELSTGVHVFRVQKREYAGLTALDEKTQLLIRNKLRGDISEREYKRIVRELKARSTIEIERD